MSTVQFPSVYNEGALVSVRSTVSFTATKLQRQIFASGGAISVTMADSPPDGFVVQFCAAGGAMTAVANTGQTINGTTGDDVTASGRTSTYTFDGETKNWLGVAAPA